MSWYVASTVNVTDEYIFTNPGVYTVYVPPNVSTAYFEIIGSGGGIYNTSRSGGNGGYIKGTINILSFIGQMISIYVGGPTTPYGNSASYITIPNVGPLFVIAGSGGGDAFSDPSTGGHGGGGNFTNNISFGIDGTGNGGGVGGGGGTTVGGIGQGETVSPFPPSPYISPINTGQSRPIPENYLEAVGGTSSDSGDAGYGGNGYTGGGGGGPGTGYDGDGCLIAQGGGGGGSSYYNSIYTTIITSYPGNNLPSDILPNYGRNGTYGYVSIEFKSN